MSDSEHTTQPELGPNKQTQKDLKTRHKTRLKKEFGIGTEFVSNEEPQKDLRIGPELEPQKDHRIGPELRSGRKLQKQLKIDGNKRFSNDAGKILINETSSDDEKFENENCVHEKTSKRNSISRRDGPTNGWLCPTKCSVVFTLADKPKYSIKNIEDVRIDKEKKLSLDVFENIIMSDNEKRNNPKEKMKRSKENRSQSTGENCEIEQTAIPEDENSGIEQTTTANLSSKGDDATIDWLYSRKCSVVLVFADNPRHRIKNIEEIGIDKGKKLWLDFCENTRSDSEKRNSLKEKMKKLKEKKWQDKVSNSQSAFTSFPDTGCETQEREQDHNENNSSENTSSYSTYSENESDARPRHIVGRGISLKRTSSTVAASGSSQNKRRKELSKIDRFLKCKRKETGGTIQSAKLMHPNQLEPSEEMLPKTILNKTNVKRVPETTPFFVSIDVDLFLNCEKKEPIKRNNNDKKTSNNELYLGVNTGYDKTPKASPLNVKRSVNIADETVISEKNVDKDHVTFEVISSDDEMDVLEVENCNKYSCHDFGYYLQPGLPAGGPMPVAGGPMLSAGGLPLGAGDTLIGAGGTPHGAGGPKRGAGDPMRDAGSLPRGPGGPMRGARDPMRGARCPPHGAGGPMRGTGGPPQGAGGPMRGAEGPPRGAGGPMRGAGGPMRGAGGPMRGAVGSPRGAGSPMRGAGGPMHSAGCPPRGAGGPMRAACKELPFLPQTLPRHPREKLPENVDYLFVFLEIESLHASNSQTKEITQIGGFMIKAWLPMKPEAQFFRTIEPKKLKYFMNNYKKGGELLQALQIHENPTTGQFQFRRNFERSALTCVSEETALEDLSKYLASAQNCVIFSLSQTNIELLITRMKLLRMSNPKIHLRTVKGYCSWRPYMEQSGVNRLELEKDFLEWYKENVEDSVQSRPEACVVAKMVHNGVKESCKFVHQKYDYARGYVNLVKSSRTIDSLRTNEKSSKIQPELPLKFILLELANSLKPNKSIKISLKKMATSEISSKDRNIEKIRPVMDHSLLQRTHPKANRLREQKKSVTCSICLKKFDDTTGHNQHVIDKHNPNESYHIPALPLDLQCAKCFKWFSHPSTRAAHMESCSLKWDVRLPCFLKCLHCGKTFSTLQAKSNHLATCQIRPTISSHGDQNKNQFRQTSPHQSGPPHPQKDSHVVRVEQCNHNRRGFGVHQGNSSSLMNPPPRKQALNVGDYKNLDGRKDDNLDSYSHHGYRVREGAQNRKGKMYGQNGNLPGGRGGHSFSRDPRLRK